MRHSDVPFEMVRSRWGRRGDQYRQSRGHISRGNITHQTDRYSTSLRLHNPNVVPSQPRNPNGIVLHPRNPNILLLQSRNPNRSSEQHTFSGACSEPGEIAHVADSTLNRYEDGEVRRFGAGESYRPFNRADRERSPRPRSPASRPRSPAARARSPVTRARSPPSRRDRGRTPPPGSDSYVPGRVSPRRRSRSIDRYRRASPIRADTWRRQDRSRSRARSPPRARSPRRASPPPRRASPGRFSPRRDDRNDRPRSPRRDYDGRASK